MDWKPGMPIIGCPTESQALLGVSTYLQWLLQNARVFEQANQLCHLQLCGTRQNCQGVQRDSRKDNFSPHEPSDKKKSRREILRQDLERVIAQRRWSP